MTHTQPVVPESPEYPAPTQASGQRRRPFGLYMILILLTVQALLGILLAAIFGVGVVVLPGEFLSTSGPQVFDLLIPLLILSITAVVVFGLWRYRPWGWYAMMLLLAYYMATDAIRYFAGQPDYVSMLLNVAMVFYLNQGEVRDLFETPVAGEARA